MIWMVDCTHYPKQIHPALQKAKQDYFRIKSYLRHQKIGPTAPVKTRVFGTGLLRLATILARNGIPVSYMDRPMLEARLQSGEEIPEKVAFSCVCPTVPMCGELARQIKALRPDAQVLIGGPHINLAPRETRERYPIFDRLVVGYELDAAPTAMPNATFQPSTGETFEVCGELLYFDAMISYQLYAKAFPESLLRNLSDSFRQYREQCSATLNGRFFVKGHREQYPQLPIYTLYCYRIVLEELFELYEQK